MRVDPCLGFSSIYITSTSGRVDWCSLPSCEYPDVVGLTLSCSSFSQCGKHPGPLRQFLSRRAVPVSQLWQWHYAPHPTNLFRKYVSQRGPEARLYIACLVALLLPTSIFIYAWTADPHIFWMWPVVGLSVCLSFYSCEDRKRSSDTLTRSSCFAHLFHIR